MARIADSNQTLLFTDLWVWEQLSVRGYWYYAGTYPVAGGAAALADRIERHPYRLWCISGNRPKKPKIALLRKMGYVKEVVKPVAKKIS